MGRHYAGLKLVSGDLHFALWMVEISIFNKFSQEAGGQMEGKGESLRRRSESVLQETI